MRIERFLCLVRRKLEIIKVICLVAMCLLLFTACNEDQDKPESILEYEYSFIEEDGVNAIMSSDSLYAALIPIERNKDYLFVTGGIGDNSNDYLLVDSLGLVKAATIEDEFYTISYTSEGLQLFDKDGKDLGIILYSKLDLLEKGKVTRASTITRNPIYESLNFINTIRDLIKAPIKTGSLKLLKLLLEGQGNRYGGMLSDFIDMFFNTTDPLGWIQLYERMLEIDYFGNAKLTTLDATWLKFNTFALNCEVEGLTQNTSLFKNAALRNEEIVEYSYTLGMIAKSVNNDNEDKKEGLMQINKDCVEHFDFCFENLQTLYNYESSLTLDVTIRKTIDLDEELIDQYRIHTPNVSYGTASYTYKSALTIYGGEKSLVTDNVSSSIEKVVDLTPTSANIICAFSDIPSGAECQVCVSMDGSDISFAYPATPNETNQTINATGLVPLTDYVANSRIIYNGIPYAGTNSVSFRTTGPSGNVISVNEIKERSSVIKCQFSGITNGLECGVIVESEDGGSRTITASNTENEQELLISGLTPSTTYTCYAYVNLQHSQGNYYSREEDGITFTTKAMGIAGTWNVVETYETRPFPGAAWETKTREYSLSLNEDGSIQISGMDTEYISGSWYYDSTSGSFNATAHIIATQTQNTWDRFGGNVDDIKAPQKITGTRYRGNMNQVTSVEEAVGSFVMTK